MGTLIDQKPKFEFLPVGQDVIFTVSNNSVVTHPDFTRVKFIAEVHISSELEVNLSNNDDVVGVFKTTPNNAGVGMFDFRRIIESFVNSDNKARDNSSFKTNENISLRTPIHIIDKFSGNNNSFRHFAIKFKIEFFDNSLATPALITGGIKHSDNYKLFNGYLKYSNALETGLGGSINNFGYNLKDFNLTYITKKFLSNAPTIQNANIEDYGTASILMMNPLTEIGTNQAAAAGGTGLIRFDYYQANGQPITGTEFETIRLDDPLTGGFAYANRDYAYNKLVYAGVFPANLRNWSTLFNDNIDDIAYYTYKVQTLNLAVASDISQTYRININCPTLKGYKPIRLTWLNQWGTWDYYTFNMKSTKSISTKGSTYQQLEGTWNEAVYEQGGYKGGKKSFRVNATEKISMNTDFVSEAESEWFEELITSPEVYILEGFQFSLPYSALNEYVIPTRLLTSSFTKKTVANDKLIQYTFEVEKSKTLRTQSI
jgi:hypothetical protein